MSQNRERPGMGKMMEEMLGWPSPDKVYGELQRLNGNLERLQPDLHKLSQSLDSINLADIRLLAQVLQGMKLPDMIRSLNEAKSTIDTLCTKLWGK